MATPLRSAEAGTFFVTAATSHRVRLFDSPSNCELFLETLAHYRSEGKFKLYDFVVMPDHIHLLLSPTEITLERAMQLIKGGFSHRLGMKTPAWQKGFTDHRVRDKPDFLARRKYIHENPVKAGLVQFAEEFPYCSAYRKNTLSG